MNKQKIFKDIEKLSDIKKVELNTLMILIDIRIAVCYIAFFIFITFAFNLFAFAIYASSAFLLIVTIFVDMISAVCAIVAIFLTNKQERILIAFLTKNRKKNK